MTDEPSFTPEEANAALEGLRATLGRVREARRILLESGRRVRRAAGGNGGGLDGAAHWEAVAVLRRELERLAADGLLLRDAESGLVDFPSEREGRRIFLCWQLGEDSVGYWHEIETGFAGRKPL